MLTFNRKILNNIEEMNSRFAIAVSGGADSMCLALSMKLYGFFPLCIIVDHGIRKDAVKEANFAAEFLKGQGFECVILKSTKFLNKDCLSNLQHRARIERYDLITKYCIENGILLICTAHNKNDVAENILLRIYRGSGIDGICGISEESSWNGVKILRPMIGIVRDDIENLLNKYNWQWINDPSNENTNFERVKFRNLINGFDDKRTLINRLLLLANNANRARNFLEEETQKYFNRICTQSTYGYIKIDKKCFIELHEELKLRLFVKSLHAISGFYYKPRLSKLQRIICLIEAGGNFKNTIAGIICICTSDEILIIREPNAICKIVVLHNKENWDQRFVIEFDKKADNLEIDVLTADLWYKLQKEYKNRYGKKPELPKPEQLQPLAMFSTPALFSNGRFICSLVLPYSANTVESYEYAESLKITTESILTKEKIVVTVVMKALSIIYS